MLSPGRGRNTTSVVAAREAVLAELHAEPGGVPSAGGPGAESAAALEELAELLASVHAANQALARELGDRRLWRHRPS
jgi:hypothetical protein